MVPVLESSARRVLEKGISHRRPVCKDDKRWTSVGMTILMGKDDYDDNLDGFPPSLAAPHPTWYFR